jgi:4,5:9,10-diseco-3-hydroxy-5,9,17-trioxoandrosta-1(10),2-diene-4-oate hydrolase
LGEAKGVVKGSRDPDSEERYLEVDETRIRYRSAGKNGKHIILVHGIGTFLESWSYNFGALSKRFRVHAFDLVGCGLSEKPAVSYSLSYFADFLNLLMKAEQMEKASLVGHSLGGAIALKFALKYREKLERIVIIDSGGLSRKVDLRLRLCSLPWLGRLLTRPSLEGSRSVARRIVFDRRLVTHDWINLSHRMSLLPGAQQALLRTIRANIDILGARRSEVAAIRNNLHLIDVPVLIMWGKEDRVIPVSAAYIAYRDLPNSTLHVFSRCGHAPHYEKHEEANELLLQFLR